VNLPIDIARIKRRLAREKIVKCGAQGIDVVQVRAALAVELLRTHKNERAARTLLHRHPAR
jgi:hypothetical protein